MAKRTGFINSVDKAFYILDLMSLNKDPMSLKELSAISGFPKSTVHALLSTMRENDIIEQDSRGYYALGRRLFEYGLSAYSNWENVQHVNPILENIAFQTNLNCILALAQNGSLINVGFWATAGVFTEIFPFVGTRYPLHATAQGKIFLASYEDKKVKKYIEKSGLKRYSEDTITDPEVLVAQLAEIRKNGYSLCSGELHSQNRAVSVPVFDSQGKVVYALGVLGLIDNIKDEDVKTIVRVLKKESKKVSKFMGL